MAKSFAKSFAKPYQKRKIERIFMQIYKKNEHLYIVFCINTRFWWAEVDSNHRSRRRQIYSLIHLAALESAHIFIFLFRCGAGDWTRTHNLLITNQLLCQLSYTGILWCLGAESNHRQADFQSAALPTELPRHLWRPGTGSNRRPPA